MRVSRVLGIALSFIVATVLACGSDESSSTTPSGDGGSDGPTPAPDGGGFCCPPDPGPRCCMDFGGWSETGSCGATCDGMPVPSTPGWKLIDDEHGCKAWSQPTGGAKCGGAVIRDAGNDASDASDASDAASDADAD